MGNKWFVFGLTLVANAAMYCVDFRAFPEGSAWHTAARVTGAVLFNALALLGVPMVGKKDGDK